MDALKKKGIIKGYQTLIDPASSPEAMKCNGKHVTERIRRLTERRNRIIKDMMCKASRRIAEWARENKVDLVVMGPNIF